MTNKRDMIENVTNSARTAEEILAHLESSLRKGGFETGLAAYLKLGETMVNQRLWTQSEASSPEIDKLFSALSARAKTLYGILGPYADLMRRLASLDSIATAHRENCAAPRNGEAHPLLQILKEGETSLSSLRTRLSLSRKDLETQLAAFQAQGRIQSRTSSGRRLYRLT
jgi:hypothetical protein